MRMSVDVLETATSTNEVALEAARSGALDGTVIIARTQSAGRGRRGRSWFSPPGGNLYLSYIHRSRLRPAALAAITLDAATAVASAVEDLSGLRVEVKWPNDLLMGGRKLGGVLTELHTDLGPDPASTVVIVGVGVNVGGTVADFPEELQPIATTIAHSGGAEVSAEQLGRLVGRRLREKLAGYEAAQGPDLTAYLTRFRGQIGRRVELDDHATVLYATVTGVAGDGCLLVRPDGADADVAVRAGEVRLLPATSPGERA